MPGEILRPNNIIKPAEVATDESKALDAVLERLRKSGGIDLDRIDQTNGITKLVIPQTPPIKIEVAKVPLDTEMAMPVISGELEALMITRPWVYLGRKAEQSNLSILQPVFQRLQDDEDQLLEYFKIKKSLLSDDPDEIRRGLERVLEIPTWAKDDWLEWITKSDDPSVRKLVHDFLAENHYQLIKTGIGQLPQRPVLDSADEVASLLVGHSREEWRAIFKTGKAVHDFGKLGGKVESITNSPFDDFVISLLNDLDRSPTDWEQWTYRITRTVDVLRCKSEQLKLPAGRCLEELVSYLVRHENQLDATLESSWDLLSRFEFSDSESLPAQILEIMDHKDGLHHPLATMLLGKLNKEHPFKKEQQQRINGLVEICQGTPDRLLEEMSKLKEFQRGIITIFPEGVPNELFGFDLETEPNYLGPQLPVGVYAGVDGGFDITELRLLSDQSILRYDNKWRERMFDLWLWAGLSRTNSASIHLHIDQNPDPAKMIGQLDLMRNLFGKSSDDLNVNLNLKTFEVRTALECYPHLDPQTLFKDGFNLGGIVELLICLKNHTDCQMSEIPKNAVDKFSMEDRFLNVALRTTDPMVRAATIIALGKNFGQRILPLSAHNLQMFNQLKRKNRISGSDLFEIILTESPALASQKLELVRSIINHSEGKGLFEANKQELAKAWDYRLWEALANQLPSFLSSETEYLAGVQLLLEASEYSGGIIKILISQIRISPISRSGRYLHLCELINYQRDGVTAEKAIDALPYIDVPPEAYLSLVGRMLDLANYPLRQALTVLRDLQSERYAAINYWDFLEHLTIRILTNRRDHEGILKLLLGFGFSREDILRIINSSLMASRSQLQILTSMTHILPQLELSQSEFDDFFAVALKSRPVSYKLAVGIIRNLAALPIPKKERWRFANNLISRVDDTAVVAVSILDNLSLFELSTEQTVNFISQYLKEIISNRQLEPSLISALTKLQLSESDNERIIRQAFTDPEEMLDSTAIAFVKNMTQLRLPAATKAEFLAAFLGEEFGSVDLVSEVMKLPKTDDGIRELLRQLDEGLVEGPQYSTENAIAINFRSWPN